MTAETELVRGLAGLLILLFAASFVGKVDAWHSWTATSWLPPGLLGRTIRLLLPALEGLTVMSLVAWPVVGLFMSSALLASLGVGVLLLTPSQKGEDCGCFGFMIQSRIGPALGARNLGLAAASVLAGAISLDKKVPRIHAPEALILLVVGLLLALGLEVRRVFPVAKALHRPFGEGTADE